MAWTNLVIAAALLAGAAGAQDGFEVATIKLSNPDRPVVRWRNYPGGRIVVTNYTLSMLIEAAYNVKRFQVVGAPQWSELTFYDVTAVPPAGSSAATASATANPNWIAPDTRPLLQRLLADRFGLKAHREMRTLPVLTLTIDKGGPKFHAERDASVHPEYDYRRATGELDARNVPMSWVAGWIEAKYNQIVVDRTGLPGGYDFHMRYDDRAREEDDAPLDPLRPPLKTAVETQLGLKVKTGKEAVEVLVIDDARKPDAN